VLARAERLRGSRGWVEAHSKGVTPGYGSIALRKGIHEAKVDGGCGDGGMYACDNGRVGDLRGRH
jgi:hypothetical protein